MRQLDCHQRNAAIMELALNTCSWCPTILSRILTSLGQDSSTQDDDEEMRWKRGLKLLVKVESGGSAV